MSKPRTIQINIPTPCSQSWEEMASTGDGRFCTHCQKTVIDFTDYSDTALYNFFATNKTPLCGHFSSTQVNRQINIPHQPHSKLYRLAIALGLTLLFTQSPELQAQTRLPISSLAPVTQRYPQGATLGKIEGCVTDSHNTALHGVKVSLMKNQSVIAEATTDTDGSYSFSVTGFDYYEIHFNCAAYRELIITDVMLLSKIVTLNATLESSSINTNPVTKICERPKNIPSSFTGEAVETSTEIKTEEYPIPGNRTFSREENK